VVDLDTGPRIVNFCSENYTLVSNEELLDPIEKALSTEFDLQKIVKIRDHAKFYIDYILKDVLFDLGNGDKVNPRIRINNSYDGSLKFQGMVGAYRLICSNGMVVGETFEKVKTMHTASVTNSAKAILEASVNIADNFKAAIEPYKELSKHTFKIDELPQIVESTMIATDFPSKQQEAVLARFEEERNGIPGAKPNLWLVYNAFNFQLNHNENIGMKEHKKDKLDHELFQYLLKSA
jgi:hypothetical protein